MIIIGYIGIGKSDLGGKSRYIDLESSLFSHDKNGNIIDGWEEQYVKVAKELSDQGFKVFVSSNKCVVDILSTLIDGTKVYVVYPDISLKDFWSHKLLKRLAESKLSKDEIALNRVMEHFEDDIDELNLTPFEKIVIDDESYSLSDMLYNLEDK